MPKWLLWCFFHRIVAYGQKVFPDMRCVKINWTKINEKCQNQELLSEVFGISKLLNLVNFGANFDYIEM